MKNTIILASQEMAESIHAATDNFYDNVEVLFFDALKKSVEAFDYDYILDMGSRQTDLKSVVEAALKRLEEQTRDEFMARLAQDIAASEEHKGRRRVEQLLGGYSNSKVCSWFDLIRARLNRFIESMKQLMVCFFSALFDLSKHESRHGRAACFYDMIRAHLKEKIPSRSTFQKALKWFKGWRKEVLAWANRKAEEEKHRIWERLLCLIKGELLRLEPCINAV